MEKECTKTHVIIGGGAAGFFGAITCAEASPHSRVILLEKNKQLLAKVRISGGGRCNVTHACFDPAQLVLNYPRGHKALRGPFSRFQPKDTIEWFQQRGVELKTESDGRMFPVTDSSETIIECLTKAAKSSGVHIRTECGVASIEQCHPGFTLTLNNGETIYCDNVLIATGSVTKTYEWLTALKHTIVPLVPSLFTFNVPSSPLKELSGISVTRVHAKILETDLEQTGPLLITHWGFSGPAILKLSAWGARVLHGLNYRALFSINWLPAFSLIELRKRLTECKSLYPARQLSTDTSFDLPRNLWKNLLDQAGLPSDLRWAMLSKIQLEQLAQTLHANVYQIDGKSTYKEEFVTCGGVSLDEVNFKTMESRLVPGLFFAGEVLDIDGVTGGFNFQNAWTTGWLAGCAMSL